MKFAPLPKKVARGSEGCEVALFASAGVVCGRRAVAVWVCDKMRKRVCRRCFKAITACARGARRAFSGI